MKKINISFRLSPRTIILMSSVLLILSGVFMDVVHSGMCDLNAILDKTLDKTSSPVTKKMPQSFIDTYFLKTGNDFPHELQGPIMIPKPLSPQERISKILEEELRRHQLQSTVQWAL